MHRRSGFLGEKRGLDPAESEDHNQQQKQPEQKKPKVPALASVIVEALKVDSLQKLCSSLEPILRRVVSEEVERALAKLGPARIGTSLSPKQIKGPDGRNLKLLFKSRLSQPLFTGGKVEGEQGASIHVVLLDANTGHVVTSGPESSAKFDVVVLEGDFNNEDDSGWTSEEFEGHIVKERDGKRPILTGELQVSLKEGVGTLGELTFTDNSSWIRSRKFRLGLKVATGLCEGIRIQEAKTEAFVVKDHRGELYRKHYPPTQKDEVWRLEKIGKDGSFHKRLNKAGIYNVEDFLRLVVVDQQKLRKVLGSGMSNKMWEILVDHAKTCVLSGKLYVYYSDDVRNVGAIFNNIFEFSGLIANERFISADSLSSDGQKVFVDSLVKKAYDNWEHVVEYDGKVLLSSKESKGISTFPNEASLSSINNPFDQQISLPRLPMTISPDVGLFNSGLASGLTEQATRHSPHASSDSHLQYGSTLYQTQQDQFHSDPSVISRNDSTGLALAPPLETNLFQPCNEMLSQHSELNSYNDWMPQRDGHQVDGFLPEEEIRMRSHELLENDEMQNLLRVFSMGGAPSTSTSTSSGLADENFGFPTYVPTPSSVFNFNEPSGGSTGGRKAGIGWLKIKAAMRWGIFIRKKAAERRKAQIVELDD